MNETILRGFCQKCGMSLEWDDNYDKKYNPKFRASHRDHYDEPMHSIEPVWFLSPNQIRLIHVSKEWNEFYEKNFNLIYPKTGFEMLAKLLEEEPFLVAKILKESEKS